MKNINLSKNENNRRRNVIASVVDEKDIEFINGVALVPATISEVDCFDKKITYTAYGLIDEDFNEVYSNGLYDGTTSSLAECSLMFFQCNQSAIRCGENDFVVEVAGYSEEEKITKYLHIRLIEGVPKIIGYLPGKARKTGYEKYITVGHEGFVSLYDFTEAKYITPELFSIKLSPVNKNVFDVIARVTIDDPDFPNKLGYIEYLFFSINLKGERVTMVRSSFVGGEGYIHIFGDTVESMLKTRAIELKNYAEYFLEEISKWRENPSYLKEHRKILNQTLEKKQS